MPLPAVLQQPVHARMVYSPSLKQPAAPPAALPSKATTAMPTGVAAAVAAREIIWRSSLLPLRGVHHQLARAATRMDISVRLVFLRCLSPVPSLMSFVRHQPLASGCASSCAPLSSDLFLFHAGLFWHVHVYYTRLNALHSSEATYTNHPSKTTEMTLAFPLYRSMAAVMLCDAGQPARPPRL